MQNRRNTLRKRIAIALVLFGLSIVTVVATISLTNFKETLNHHLYAHLDSVASVQKERVEMLIERYEERIALLSSRTQLRLSLQQYQKTPDPVHINKITQILHDAKQAVAGFQEIAAVNLKGEVIASTNPQLVGQDQGHDNKVIWRIYKEASGQLSLHTHTPLRIADELVGFLHVSASTSELVRITGNYDGLGESGEMIIAEQLKNGDARFLTPLRFDPDAALQRTIKAERTDVPIIRALAGQVGFHKDIVDYREVPVVAVTAYIPKLRWGVLIKMDQQEVYQPYDALLTRLLQLFALIFVSGIVVTYVVANHISEPLAYLTGVVNRIRQGEHLLRVDLESTRFDQETHELATSINELTDELLQTFDLSPSGMLLVDGEGTILRCNKAVNALFGYEGEVLIGESVEMLVPQGKRAAHYGQREEFTLNRDVYRMGGGQELFGLKSDNTSIPVEIGISTIPHQTDRRFLVSIADISDRIERIREEEIQKEKDDFFASMSHELRTPLTAIIGNSNYMLDEDLSAEHLEILRSIKAAGKTQLALVNDILDMSKIESGKFSILEAPYNFSKLLQSVEQIFHLKAQDEGIDLIVEQLNEEPKLLIGDVQRIQQVLVNLVGNAIKFTSKGSVKLTTEVKNQKLIFKVEDTGIGMSNEVLGKLFKRFEQADGSISRRYGGSGLGLYISTHLAELMGGTIAATSEENVGSTFVVTLSYQQSKDFVRLTNAEVTVNKKSQFSGEVLVAEDTPLLQQLERRTLEKMGITVSLAENGEEAVKMASEQKFDLILMDMQMPIMDGIEATRILREQGEQTPIIAVTANVLQKHRDAFNQAGCDAFLGKPFEEQALKSLLGRYLHSTQDSAEVERRKREDRRAGGSVVDTGRRQRSRRVDDGLSQPAADLSKREEVVDNEMMAEFYQDLADKRQLLLVALAENDLTEVAAIAHSIKGYGTPFGFPQLSEKGKWVCDAMDSGQADQVPDLAEALIVELEQLLL